MFKSVRNVIVICTSAMGMVALSAHAQEEWCSFHGSIGPYGERVGYTVNYTGDVEIKLELEGESDNMFWFNDHQGTLSYTETYNSSGSNITSRSLWIQVYYDSFADDGQSFNYGGQVGRRTRENAIPDSITNYPRDPRYGKSYLTISYKGNEALDAANAAAKGGTFELGVKESGGSWNTHTFVLNNFNEAWQKARSELSSLKEQALTGDCRRQPSNSSSSSDFYDDEGGM